MIIPEGFAQVTFTFSGGDVPHGAVTTLGLANPSDKDALTIAQDATANWQATIRLQQPASIVMSNVNAKKGPNATGLAADSPSTQAGALAGSCVPINTAYIVQKITNVGGRKGRGRMYIPGIRESDVDSFGQLAGAQRTALVGAWGSLFAAFIADDLAPVLLHSDGTPPTPLTTFNVLALVGTQRRRMRR